MNHNLWAAVGARVIALSFVIAGVSACGERISDTSSKTPAPVAASPSAVVIGTAPGQPSSDPPGTTSVVNESTELSKQQESKAMPMEGQHNSFMTESQKDSQRTGTVDAQTERRKQ